MGTLLSQTSSLSHLLSNEHELNFDQRTGHPNHQDGNGSSGGGNAAITDDEDCSTVRNGNVSINDDIAD